MVPQSYIIVHLHLTLQLTCSGLKRKDEQSGSLKQVAEQSMMLRAVIMFPAVGAVQSGKAQTAIFPPATMKIATTKDEKTMPSRVASENFCRLIECVHATWSKLETNEELAKSTAKSKITILLTTPDQPKFYMGKLLYWLPICRRPRILIIRSKHENPST